MNPSSKIRPPETGTAFFKFQLAGSDGSIFYSKSFLFHVCMT